MRALDSNNKQASPPCVVQGCERGGRRIKGMCKFHWQRQYLGVPLDAPEGYRGPADRRFGPRPTPATEKVLRRVPGGAPEECWNWSNLGTQGYGTVDDFTGGKRTRLYVHRVAYEALVGPIPEGLTIDHLCMNKACYNPAHLEAVTQSENSLRYLRIRWGKPA